MKAKFRFLCSVSFLALLTLSTCASRTPILVGLAVELTGKQADVGINIRDAAQMAVDEINEQGGVNGQPLELIIRDDQGRPEVAQKVDAELLEMGVVAILGHYTSNVAAAVIDQMNAAEVVLISPTASSSYFSGKDDYFFRLISDTGFIGEQMGKHIDAYHEIERLLGVYDDNNRAYAKSYWDALSETFVQLGGHAETLSFIAGETDLQKLAVEISEANPDGLVIVASAVDTAIIAQYIRQLGLEIPLFTSPWAQTSQLTEKGGRAVEGLEISAFYNPNNQLESHRVFAEKFTHRYRRQPLLGTSQAYEMVLVLAEALKKTGGKSAGLPQALLELNDFPGVLGPITFDEFGDVHREVYIMRVEDGQIREQHIIPVE